MKKGGARKTWLRQLISSLLLLSTPEAGAKYKIKVGKITRVKRLILPQDNQIGHIQHPQIGAK